MFIIFNKQKIYSYLVALSTVIVLFVIAFAVTTNSSQTLQTSTNHLEQNNIENIMKKVENENAINSNNKIEEDLTNKNMQNKQNEIIENIEK